jgi:hypothetical protein
MEIAEPKPHFGPPLPDAAMLVVTRARRRRTIALIQINAGAWLGWDASASLPAGPIVCVSPGLKPAYLEVV